MDEKKIRFIGLDYGDKTIGVALGCVDSRVATGLTTLRRNLPEALRQNINSLREIIGEYKITNIVLGYPLNMDGSASPRSEKTLLFRDKLQRNFKSIKIELWDERLSTKAVTRAFYEYSHNTKQNETYRLHIDEMAAVYILQGYLDNRMEENMDQEQNMAHDDANDVILMTDDDGNEYQLHVLATKEGENCLYLLAAVEEDEGDTSEVLHFKCAPIDDITDENADDEELELELVDETHEDFEKVLELFAADYEELEITIDEEDLPLGV